MGYEGQRTLMAPSAVRKFDKPQKSWTWEGTKVNTLSFLFFIFAIRCPTKVSAES